MANGENRENRETEQKPSRFSDWDECTTVDCNDCDEWWRNKCDGVYRGQERPCTAFKASRRVSIPLKIKSLQSRLKWLTGLFAGLLFVQAITLGLIAYIFMLLGG